MPELLQYEVSFERGNRQYHINYNSALTTFTDTKDYQFELNGQWRKVIEGQPDFLIKPALDARDIVTISEDGFKVNMNKMKTNEPYHLSYFESGYELLKNSKGELEVYEIA